MARQGEEFNDFVAALERLALQDPNVTVEKRVFLKDKDTGQAREHDIIITVTSGHHKMVTSIECRDRTRPVGVNEVEAFQSKCARTGVHRAIFVSSSGFAETAKVKAKAWSIECLSLKEAIDATWSAPPVHVLNFWGTKFDMTFNGDFHQFADFRVYDGEGREIDDDWKSLYAYEYLSDRFTGDQQTHNGQFIFNVSIPGAYAVEDTGRRVSIRDTYGQLSYRFELEVLPTVVHTYKNEETGEVLMQAAVRRVYLEKGVKDIVILKDGNGFRISETDVT